MQNSRVISRTTTQRSFFENCEQIRDYIHVSDVARANRLAIERDAARDVAINVGTGTPRSIRDISKTLIDLYGKSDELRPEIANEFRQGDIRHCNADTERAMELREFEQNIDFTERMRESVNWGREQEAEDRFEHAQSELDKRGLR